MTDQIQQDSNSAAGGLSELAALLGGAAYIEDGAILFRPARYHPGHRRIAADWLRVNGYRIVGPCNCPDGIKLDEFILYPASVMHFEHAEGSGQREFMRCIAWNAELG